MMTLSKKVLAVVSAIAILASCMVFSFTAAAATKETLMWENSYDNGTASNWASQYKGETARGPQNSGMSTGNYAVADGGAMKLGFSTEASETYASGYNFYHKAATHDDAAVRYGYDGRYSGTMSHPYGIIRPENGTYKLTLDYKVASFNQNTASTVDLYIGYANEIYWDGNVTFYTITTNKAGVYEKIATVDYDDIAKGWQSIELTFDLSTTYTPILFLFAKVMDNASGDLTNAEVLIDSVKVYEVEEIADQAYTKMWENSYDNGTASNWASQYKGETARGPQNSGMSTGNYAVADGGAMKLGFSTEASETYASGYNFYHKSATHNDASVRYGYDGRYSGTTSHPYGIIRPENGTYKIDLDYKVESFNQNTASIVDLYIGYANEIYWDGNVTFYTITTNKAGVYEKLTTVDYDDIAKGWQSLSYTFTLSSSYTPILFIFAKVMDNSANELTDAVVLVDNVEIYECNTAAFSTVSFYYEGAKVGEASGAPHDPFVMPTLSGVPADCEYYADAACTQKIDLPTTFPATSLDIYIAKKIEQVPMPMNTVMWKNSFDNGSTTNWMSRMGAADGNGSFNSGRVHTSTQNYAVLKTEDNNTFMALGYGNYASREYLSGFVFFHEGTTHKDPSREGYVGLYSGKNFDVGNFYAPLGSYKVSLKYNLAQIQTGDGPNSQFDLYVTFGNENLYWDGNKSLVNMTNCLKICTVTADDLGRGWQEVSAYIENTTGYSMHFFIAQSPEYKNSLTNSELWIDDVQVSTSNYTSVTFYSDTTLVGQAPSAEPGSPFTMPTLTLPAGVPAGYRLVFYSDAACTNEIDVPTVYPNETQKIYVKVVKEVKETWSFETEANNSCLSLNTRPETTIYTDTAVKHSGNAAVRVNSDAAEDSTNLYAQMLVKNGADAQVHLTAGKNYEIKFWVYQPAAHGNYALDYWFAVSGDDAVFDADYDAVHSRKHGTVVEGVFTPTATNAWQEVTVTIKDCAYMGKLRMGIIGDKNNAHPFYIDDITVTEMSSEPNVWSFDKETLGATVDINTSDPGRTITIDDFIKYSGYHSARFNGNSKLTNAIPQMMVKNDDGEQFYVYEGRSYEVKFYLYKPETQPKYGISYWLTATTEEEDKEFNRTDYLVSSYRVAGQDDVKVDAGEWVEFVITIKDCAHTGKLRLGIGGDYNGDFLFFIDDLVVSEVFLEPDSKTDSFERYEEGEVLSLNEDGATITVTDEDRRSGGQAAKIVTRGNSIDAAPQMVVNDFRANAIKVEKGKNYRVSFWVMRPMSESDYALKYWLAATDDNEAFVNSRENVIVDTTTVAIEKSHVWQLVKLQIKNCPVSGNLRLGITGSTEEVHTFFIDDVLAYEDTAGEPDPNAMNFEMYDVGTNLALNQHLPDNDTHKWNKNIITVTDAESYTGNQSVLFYANTNMTNNRPHMLIRDGSGNVIKVKKGDDFFVSLMMYVDPSAPYFSFNCWLAVTPEEYDDRPFFGQLSDNPEFSVTAYMLPDEKFEIMPPEYGVWTEIKFAIMDCPYSGSLRLGACHGNAAPYESSFYFDDIKVYDPEYVTVKFESNGSQDTYPDVTVMSEMLLPMTDYIDPYREGYEFLGWYTSPTFEKDTFFEIYSDRVIGKTGDVITLYARWREWSENVASTDRPKDEEKFEYQTEYYTEKVWIGDQNVPQNPYSPDIPSRNDAASVDTTPSDKADDSGIPPWLIVVIIAAAVVVVGGGATLAAVLIKKSKKA